MKVEEEEERKKKENVECLQTEEEWEKLTKCMWVCGS